jgi:hypothetical protein
MRSTHERNRGAQRLHHELSVNSEHTIASALQRRIAARVRRTTFGVTPDIDFDDEQPRTPASP